MKTLLALALLTLSTSVWAGQRVDVPFITQPGLPKAQGGPSSSWVRTGAPGTAVLALSEFDGRSYRITAMVSDSSPSTAPNQMAMLDLRLHGQTSAVWSTTDSPCRLTVQVLKTALQVSGSSPNCVGAHQLSYDGTYVREK